MRFYELNSGKITIGGQDISKWKSATMTAWWQRKAFTPTFTNHSLNIAKNKKKVYHFGYIKSHQAQTWWLLLFHASGRDKSRDIQFVQAAFAIGIFIEIG